MMILTAAIAVALAAVALASSPAAAFGLGDVISDFLYYRESLAADRAWPSPKGTLFLDAVYTREDQRFDDFGSATASSYGGQVGVLYAPFDRVLVHGTFRGFGSDVKFSFDDDTEEKFRSRFIETRLGADLIYLDTKPLKAWLTLEGRFANSDTDASNAFWSWRAAASTTLSWRIGNVLLEPMVGVVFADSFDRDTERVTLVGAGFAAKYRGERWRPQLNFAYSKVVDPNIHDDGFIEVGPEVLYAVTPSLLVGLGYTYGTPIDRDIHFDSHTAMLRIRWTF